MEPALRYRGRWLAGAVLAGLTFWLGRVPVAQAGPLEEIKANSGLGTVDARQLINGAILSVRGSQGSFSRGIYIESCYFLKAPVAVVGESLLHWDPAKIKETEVSAYRTYPAPAADPFGAFRLLNAHPLDRWLIDATLAAVGGRSRDLHLARSDAAFFYPETLAAASPQEREDRCNAIWQQILRARSDAFANGGLEAVPAYTTGGVTLAAAAEFKSLLKMTPAIAARFGALTSARPLLAGGTSVADEAVPYIEESDVHGHSSFCLGLFAARKSPSSWQVIDCTYYTADTYFMSVALRELWPWQNGTLVWQVDYASAPFRGYTGGLDRLFAGHEMVKEAAPSVRIFRRVVEQAVHPR